MQVVVWGGNGGGGLTGGGGGGWGFRFVRDGGRVVRVAARCLRFKVVAYYHLC